MVRTMLGKLDPLALPDRGLPPSTVRSFYAYFLRRVAPWLAAAGAIGILLALIDASLLILIGRVIKLTSGTVRLENRDAAFITLGLLCLIALGLRPALGALQAHLTQCVLMPYFSNLVRWQTHCFAMRNPLGLFRSDHPGRIAGHVVGAGLALQHSAVSLVNIASYVLVYVLAGFSVFAVSTPWLLLVAGAWLLGYVLILWHALPALSAHSAKLSETHSRLFGRLVDTYANVFTIKLYHHKFTPLPYVREAFMESTSVWAAHMIRYKNLQLALYVLNAGLYVSTAFTLIVLLYERQMPLSSSATLFMFVLQLSVIGNRAAYDLADTFDRVGIVRQSVNALFGAPPSKDEARQELRVTRGEIEFKGLRFGYDGAQPIFEDLNLCVRAGERVGLVGISGVGKSTLFNLILRLYDFQAGAILIDGQDLGTSNADSVRAQIAVVTQDAALLHMSIADNIHMGRPSASAREIEEAARMAQAHDFILALRDTDGRTGYDAIVGDRGALLSGGQRQQIALARALLKGAPILLLDEATSALDTVTEHAVERHLFKELHGQTVIAIAHRMSSLASMDRLVVLYGGCIAEQGTHAELLRLGGHYAALWKEQLGGDARSGAVVHGSEAWAQ